MTKQNNPVCLFFILIFLLTASCNSTENNSAESIGQQDTIQEATSQQNITPTVDTTSANKSISGNSTGQEPNYRESDALAILESKIIFDADFKPSLFAKLKNNMNEGVVALEMIIDPNDRYKKDCEKIIVKKKVSIPPGKTITFKERIKEVVESGCLKIELARIYLGDFILTSGKKTSLQSLFFESLDKQ